MQKIEEHNPAIKMERQPRHGNGKLYVQSNRIFGGFQECESLNFWMTPSPNEIVSEKAVRNVAAKSDKGRQ
jgi:hypothetical protein